MAAVQEEKKLNSQTEDVRDMIELLKQLTSDEKTRSQGHHDRYKDVQNTGKKDGVKFESRRRSAGSKWKEGHRYVDSENTDSN